MQIVYTRETPPEAYRASIFLAGPTPRGSAIPSWRPRAIELLRERGYEGVVFVPENPDPDMPWDHYEEQVAWEKDSLARADCILFWVPRCMETLPALTTNCEWGAWHRSGKVVLGAPADAPHLRYLRHTARDRGAPESTTLEAAVDAALARIGEPALRQGAETQVPLFVWRSPAFAAWYEAQRTAGNRLEGAEVLWSHRTGPGNLFAFALRAAVHVAAEERVKANELVIARPDVSAALAYLPQEKGDPEVLLVREFRTAVRNPHGFVLELPGGSSWDPSLDPREVARSELAEEAGVEVDLERLRPVASRQLAGTLLTHHAHLYAVELTPAEAAAIRAESDQPRDAGGPNSERTYPALYRLSTLRSDPRLDWSTLGMIHAALASSAR